MLMSSAILFVEHCSFPRRLAPLVPLQWQDHPMVALRTLVTQGSCPQTRLLGPEAACLTAPCPLLVAWLQPSLVFHSCAVALCCLQKRLSQMLHLGAFFFFFFLGAGLKRKIMF